MKQITERMMEMIEEMGKIPVWKIENLEELQEELDKMGYNSYLDDSTDYLIVETM